MPLVSLTSKYFRHSLTSRDLVDKLVQVADVLHQWIRYLLYFVTADVTGD